MQKATLILSQPQLTKINEWLNNLTPEDFGSSLGIHTAINSEGNRRICWDREGGLGWHDDVAFSMRPDVAQFVVTLIDHVHGGDHVYAADTDTVFNVCGEPIYRSFQKFVSDALTK